MAMEYVVLPLVKSINFLLLSLLDHSAAATETRAKMSVNSQQLDDMLHMSIRQSATVKHLHIINYSLNPHINT